MHVITQITSGGQSVITAGTHDGEPDPVVGMTVESGTGKIVSVGPVQILADQSLSRRVRDGLIALVVDAPKGA
jgi:hypothetical protein